MTENNPKFLQTEVRKAKTYKKQLESTDPKKAKGLTITNLLLVRYLKRLLLTQIFNLLILTVI